MAVTRSLLKHDINAHRREYFIKKVNEPLLAAIEVFGAGVNSLKMLLALIEIVRDIKKYPTPTLDNVVHPNSKWLLLCLSKYLEYEKFTRIALVVTVLVHGVVIKNEHSPNYGDRISFWVEILPKGWKGRSLNHPKNGWAEPKPYGGR